MIYLYIKTHNKTGLKYLGKTTKEDPHSYHGSGKRWLRHLKKHGFDYSTKILLETEDENELRKVGIYYSRLWNVVESDEFANLMEETGTGGDNSKNIDYEKIAITKKKNGKTWKQSKESNAKRSKAMTGKKKSNESIKKTVNTRKKNGYVSWTRETHPDVVEKCRMAHLGKPKTPEHIESMKKRPQDTNTLTCPHCNKIGDYKNMKRWHMDRCKNNPNRITDKDPKNIKCNNCGYTAKKSPNFFKYHGHNCKLRP